VIGLVGVDTLQDPDAPSMTTEAIQRSVRRFEENFANAMRELVSAAMFVPESDPELESWIAEDMASAAPEVGTGALRGTLLWHSTSRSEALASLPAPMRLVNSTLFPTNTAAVERYGIDVVIMPEVGHFLMMEAPESFNGLLSSAIEEFVE
jgi:pimeloyl-ACP methyl ester carboxylesterase